MKILICGAKGQLGNECRALALDFPAFSFIFTDIDELNICDHDAVAAFLKEEAPDVIFNCAAYTAVDKAESEPDKAFDLNRNAVRILAQECVLRNIYLVHFSTDYVFDGEGERPYSETDSPAPVSVYAKSKWAGEQEVFAAGGNAMIVRTSWLYSSFGNNFVKTMLRLASEKGEVRVVNDQYGCPTYARDLAQAMLTIVPLYTQKSGVHVYHFANCGITTWYEFATSIFEITGMPCTVHPVSTKDYPTPTKRPKYSVLDTQKFSQTFHYPIPCWKQSLADCLKLIQ